MHKHYVVIVYNREGHTFALDSVDQPDSVLKDILTQVKDAKIPFTHRVWFSYTANPQLVLEEQDCVYKNLVFVNNLDELFACLK